MLLLKLVAVVVVVAASPVDQARSNAGADSANGVVVEDDDQPVDTTDQLNQWMQKLNQTEIDYMRTMRDRRDSSKSKSDDRTKDNWLQVLKDNILRQVGRSNGTAPKLNASATQIFLGAADDFVAEKIRSYYPSCEVPKNTDHDLWKDDNTMNLFFNVDYRESANAGLAAAMLRLYRTPPSNDTAETSCENTSDEQLLRVSIYWYTKSLKKQRVKRRLSDSKVVGENSKWVELSVLPAAKAWIKGKNLGMAVIVEDQEGNVLKADKYFKGASCMVGTSTPKPIPTAYVDSKFWAMEQPADDLGAALYSNILLLPTIDVCTVELPQNATLNPNGYRNACDFKRIQNQIQKQEEGTRHIRHQRHLVILSKADRRTLRERMENATDPNPQR